MHTLYVCNIEHNIERMLDVLRIIEFSMDIISLGVSRFLDILQECSHGGPV